MKASKRKPIVMVMIRLTEFKVENLNRPNKAIVYPFAFLVLFVFLEKKYFKLKMNYRYMYPSHLANFQLWYP